MALTKAHSRMIEGTPVNVFDFGVVGDGVTDDSSAVQAAANYCVANGKALYAPAGYEIYLASAVDLKSIKYIQFDSDILVSTSITDVPVVCGGRAQEIGGKWQFNRVSDGSSFLTGTPPSRPILRIFGSKAVAIEIGSSQYVQLYSDASVSTGTSNAYNTIQLHGAVYKFEMFGEAGTSWVNENFIHGGRIKKLVIDGTNYGHNHNKFYNNTFEGTEVDIDFIGEAQVNTIYGARFESASSSNGITFGSDTYSNYVIGTWSGAGHPRPQFEVDVPVTDNGEGNAVFTEASHMFEKTPVLDVGQANISLATSTSSFIDDIWGNQGFGRLTSQNRISPQLAGIVSDHDNRYLATTDYVEVRIGDVFHQEATYAGSLTRADIYVFDSNMAPLTSEGASGAFIAAPSYTFTTSNGYGVYTISASLTKDGLSDIAIIRPEVKYIKICLFTVGTSSSSVIQNYRVSLFTPVNNRGLSQSYRNRRLPVGVLDGTPTSGYAPLNYMIYETGGSTLKRVTYAYETQVDGALSAGDTSITVNAAGSIANGDIVGIMLDNDTTHWTTVSSLSSNTFTIAAVPSGRSVADEARIVFNRWA